MLRFARFDHVKTVGSSHPIWINTAMVVSVTAGESDRNGGKTSIVHLATGQSRVVKGADTDTVRTILVESGA